MNAWLRNFIAFLTLCRLAALEVQELYQFLRRLF